MITIVALTPAGQGLGQRLAHWLGGAELLYKPKPFGATVQQRFQSGHRLILITATGIAVRTLAPVIADKHRDPPVLVLDENGRFVIPLLSGHEGGANAWGAAVADHLQAQWVSTTASPYASPVYTVGMGCERDCADAHLQSLLRQALEQAQLHATQITLLTSIDIKADETGLQRLAESHQWPFETWPAARLNQVEPLLTQRSQRVFEEVGAYGVAEAAALVAAQARTGQPATLLVPKIKNAHATCAIARSYHLTEDDA